MKQSKVIFGVIAAIVAIAVIVVIAISSGSKPEAPSTSGGEQVAPSTDEPSLDVPSTSGNDATEPSDTKPAPTDPVATEPSSPATIPDWLKPFISTGATEPPAPELPKYEEIDLPASSGMNYNNDKSVSITVDYEFYGLKKMKISFGTGMSGTKQYIALNPHVEIVSSQGATLTNDYQYYFMPSDGYVTTITGAEYGCYIDGVTNSTFRRAIDYALPSDYISDELPGTIWYMDASEKAKAPYIDVLVYNYGELFATLRLNIAKDNSGKYYLESIGNQNQLDADCIDEKLDDFYLDGMINDAWDYLQSDFHISAYFSTSNFIVERRAVGESTYFDFINPLESQAWGRPKSDFSDCEVIAVSYRSKQTDSREYRAITFYYVIPEDPTADYDFELLGIDHPLMYNVHELAISGWPGYTKNPEESWYINPPFEI